MFSQPDWRTLVESGAPTDSLAGMGEKRLEELLTAGLAVFTRWRLPKPCAFRAGNLQVDAKIYPILKRLGFEDVCEITRVEDPAQSSGSTTPAS